MGHQGLLTHEWFYFAAVLDSNILQPTVDPDAVLAEEVVRQMA